MCAKPAWDGNHTEPGNSGSFIDGENYKANLHEITDKAAALGLHVVNITTDTSLGVDHSEAPVRSRQEAILNARPFTSGDKL